MIEGSNPGSRFDVAAYNAMVEDFMRQKGLPVGGDPINNALVQPQQPGGGPGLGGAISAALARQGAKSLFSGGAAAAEGATAAEATAASQAAWNSGAMAANSSSVGAGGAQAAQGGINSWMAANPGLTGAGALAAVVAATPYVDKYLTPAAERANDWITTNLFGRKMAQPMTRDQVANSSLTLGRQLPGYAALDTAGRQRLADYLMQNNLLSDSKTKRGSDAVLDGEGGAKVGLNYGLGVLASVRNNPRINARLAAAGLSNPFGGMGKSGPMRAAPSSITQMGVGNQVGIYDALFTGRVQPQLAARLQALRELSKMYGAEAAAPTAPARSRTDSPGMKDGKRVNF